MSETCKGCHFWRRLGLIEHGETENRRGRCKRNAPVDRGMNNAFWPETHESDWCGEFKPLSTDATAKGDGE